MITLLGTLGIAVVKPGPGAVRWREGNAMARLPAGAIRWVHQSVRFVLLTSLLLTSTFTALTTASQRAGATDEITEAINTINTYRSSLGLPPMSRNPALEAAATAHARYYQANAGDSPMSGMGLHAETPDHPGFTGADMQDRAKAQGYSGSVNENIGMSGSPMASLDSFIGTINHRLTLIDPRYTDIGIGAINDGGSRIEVVDVGAPTWSDTASPDWVAWPPDGTSGVGLSFSGEAPNPFPGASYPVGYPITLKYHGAGTVSFDSATLAANGQNVPVIAATGSGWLTQRTYMIAASQPLQPDTAYTITAQGSANGNGFTRTWSFRTEKAATERLASSAPLNVNDLPPGVATTDPAIQRAWWVADYPVLTHSAQRSWLWGPDVFSDQQEPFAEAPGGKRQVDYFDKGRMEITNPDGDRSSEWFVTSGLLVRDMILGAAQTGESTFEQAKPAEVELAGDPLSVNPDAPTYASLNHLAAVADGRRAANRHGQGVQETLDRAGNVGTDPSLGGYTTLAGYDDVTGHNIAGVFSDWMATRDYDPLYVIGRPLAEPYWVRTRVAGIEEWVLVQAFERRVLTFNPANTPEWRIEMGNAGRHYYEWRYKKAPPGS